MTPDELQRHLDLARPSLAPPWDEERSSRLEAELPARERAHRRTRVLAAAAALFLVLSATAFLWRARTPDVSMEPLADAMATEVPSAEGRRFVVQRGVVRFAVKPGRARAVSVIAGDVEVRVTGTRFLVERIEARVRVAVEEGAVEVRWDGQRQAVREGTEAWFPPAAPLPERAAPSASPGADAQGSRSPPVGPGADGQGSPSPPVGPGADGQGSPSPPVGPGADAQGSRSPPVEPGADAQRSPSLPVGPASPGAEHDAQGSSLSATEKAAPLVPSAEHEPQGAVSPPPSEVRHTPSPKKSAASPTATPARPSDWKQLATDGDFTRAWDAMKAAPAPRDETGELLLAADVARLSGHPEAAVAPLEQVVEHHATDARASLAAFTLGRVLLDDLGRPREAATAFESARTLAPASRLAEDALARQVEAASRAQDPRTRELAETFVQRYPSSPRLRAVRHFGGLTR